MLDSFDGIYNKLIEQFGRPPDNIDKDSRIYILVLNIAGGALPNGVRVVGYFSPIDQFRNAELLKWTRKRSNEVDMLYIDSISLASDRFDIKSVVAHEFTHLIQWGSDPEETVWVNEGIAVYAESTFGYNVKDRISAFEKNYDISLRDWNDTVEDYGSAYLFFAYIAEHFGGTEAVADILKNNRQDTIGIEKALAQLGKQISFNDIFSDWVIANYLDDPSIYDGKYGYSTLDISLKPSTTESQYPIAQKSRSILPWSAQYIDFLKGDKEQLSLDLFDEDQDEINARAIIKTGDGKVNILPFVNETEPRNLAIDTGALEVTMVITSQPDPPDAKRRSSTYIYSAETKMASISVEPSGSKITTWGSVKKN